jgi:hypothetical protein
MHLMPTGSPSACVIEVNLELLREPLQLSQTARRPPSCFHFVARNAHLAGFVVHLVLHVLNFRFHVRELLL